MRIRRRELQQAGRGRGFRAVVLPSGIPRDVAPFADGSDVKRADLRAGLFIDFGDFDIVVLRTLLPKASNSEPTARMISCCFFGKPVENGFRHQKRLQHEPVGRTGARGQGFRDFLEPE